MLNARLVSAAFVVLSASPSWSQAEEKATARDMYFAGLEGGAGSSRKKSTTSGKKLVPDDSKPVPGQQAGAGRVPRERIDMPGLTQVALRPLGLRYSLLKVAGPDSIEVAPDTRFRSGDRIRIKVQANDDGYLYIVHQGTSGDWRVMFPSNARNQGSNQVRAGEEYILPPNSAFRFGGAPGIEKLFVVLTRQPEHTLDEVIYNLRDRPGSTQPPRDTGGGVVLMAQNTVSDPLINRLRASHNRDLILEEVKDETPERHEQAVYVVNAKGAADARVVADIQLVHQ